MTAGSSPPRTSHRSFGDPSCLGGRAARRSRRRRSARLTTQSLRATQRRTRCRRVDGRQRRGTVVEIQQGSCDNGRARDNAARVDGARREPRRRCRAVSASAAWRGWWRRPHSWSGQSSHCTPTGPFESPTGWTRQSCGRLRACAAMAHDVLDGVNRVSMGWTMTIAAIALIVTLIVFRRWRHLFTFVGSVLALELLGGFLYDAFARPLPYDVTVIGLWRGFSYPSVPVAVLTFIVVGIVCTLVVPGRPRGLDRGGGRPRDLLAFRAAVSRCRSSIRCAGRHRADRDPSQRLPLLHAE